MDFSTDRLLPALCPLPPIQYQWRGVPAQSPQAESHVGLDGKVLRSRYDMPELITILVRLCRMR